MKKCFCLLLTLLCISYSVMAAPGFRIKGKIVDANNNQPIDFADVLLFREGDVNPVFHALPDPDGTFRIADVKDGKYNLLVRLVGYDLYNRPGIVLDAVSKAVDLGTIAMKPLEVGLAEVEVVAQKKQVIYKLDKKVIEVCLAFRMRRVWMKLVTGMKSCGLSCLAMKSLRNESMTACWYAVSAFWYTVSIR